MLKKFLLLIIFILALNNFALAFNLPDEFGAWHKDSEQIKNLDASYNNSKFGIWINKIYKCESPVRFLEANLITLSDTSTSIDLEVIKSERKPVI